MVRTVLLSAALVAAACTGRGSPDPSSPVPGPSGSIRDFLQEEADRLDGPGPGGVILAIVGPDGTVAAASGRQSGGDRIPLDGRVRIGSVTKTFVAATVLQLVEEGKVDLDAPARSYLEHPSLPPGVTVRDLLQHTSGIVGAGFGPDLARMIRDEPTRAVTPLEVLGWIRGAPPLFAPGEGWSYSNTNYIFLGLVVEAVTGEPVAEVLRERIVEPLGLSDTYLAGAAAGPPVVRAPIWVPEGDAGTLMFGPDHPYTLISTFAWTAGAVVSSARDLGTFFDALFHGHLVSDRGLDAMTRPAPGSEADDRASAYGLGLTEWRPTELPSVTLYGHG
jgi:D-alanyl-D-alanine carboxypeptidase